MNPFRLSNRQVDILVDISNGLICKECAGKYGVSESTAKSYMKLVRRKLGARTTPHAVKIYTEWKLKNEKIIPIIAA